MKPFLKLLFLLILFTGVLSCRKKEVNEVKVTDFPTLASQFKEPPAEYTTAPFFVWNAKITKEEIEKDLISFRDAGTKQVFVHPRPGLITEYLSDEWFDLFKFTVDKGKELGMNIWMYDENSYPSGFAGGHVPAVMPESYNQGQGLRMVKSEMLPDTCEKYFMCLKEDNGVFSDITSSLATEKGKTGKYYLFSKTYQGKSDWYGGFSYVDLLYPGVTQKFIEVTMKGYEKYLGADFGKTLPGTFTDEPQIASPGGIRWTPDLFEVFRKKWGYDLREQLPSLFEEVGDWKKVRHNYVQTLLQMFIDRWAKPWYAYCEEKGLKFTGHYWEHEWPSMRHGGDNMAMYAWHHVPAIDMLFNQFNDSVSRAQFGNVRSVKELASVANQTGRQRKLSETYGGSGWDLSFTDMKRNGDWEYVLGVNLMNQHLTYFTLAGARKYDYPPSFDYHEPWWKDYKYINDHYARLSLALSAGRQINNILVLEPSTTAWLYDSYLKSNPGLEEVGQSFQSFVTRLEKSQVEYDLGSEQIISDLGRVSGGEFIVGQAKYKSIVIPPNTENLNSSTFGLLEKFIRAGGTVIAFSTPERIDGAISEKPGKLFSSNADNIIIKENLSDEIISQYLCSNDFSLKSSGGVVFHQRRILSDGQLVFIVNSDLAGNAEGSVSAKGRNVLELNTLSGEVSEYPGEPDGDKVNIAFSLPPAGSLLLFIPETGIEGYQVKQLPGKMTEVEASSPVTVTKNEDNAIMIDFCDVEAGGEVTRDLHTYYAADKVFRFYGFSNGDPWNTSVQYKTNIVDRDTFNVKTGFTATYHFTVDGRFDMSGIKAVIERPSLWEVTVNGKELKAEDGKWWLDRSFGIFSIGQVIRTGENIITLKTSPMKVHAEIEPVYLTGDFSVIPAEKGWKISAPAKAYVTGPWTSQGLPFYSWDMTYSKKFSIENTEGRWEIALGKWNGTVAEVWVNGQKANPVAFPPYTSDITGLLRSGENNIEVRVIGSLRNLLGPHHRDQAPGLASPGSWRNIRTYPAGKDYKMIDYGLFEDFKLYRSM